VKRKGISAAVTAVLTGGAVLMSAGVALAKTTVELTADHRTVRTGHAVTLTAYATTDPNASPKNLRLCLETLTTGHGYAPFGACVKVTRVHAGVDIFVIRTVFHKAGSRTLRALAITPDGRPWTAPSSALTITVR
jgi:hypothetical protein